MTAAAGVTPAPFLTERLLLRPLRNDDAGALLRFRAHPSATRYLSHGPLTPEQNSARLQQALFAAESSTAEWFHFGWAIELQATGEIVGDGRTWNTEEPPAPGRIPAGCASLGYVLHPDHHGLGLGREAVGALIEWLFSVRGCETIFAGVYEPNLPSRRLLEALGFGKDRFFPVAEDTAGKQLPSWRYRLDRVDRSPSPRPPASTGRRTH
ncbi:GNAT family N-acetyltransferase [Arthrobacter sp. ov118]|uniref:GNAT family N-acetyltransferase n=1 Tax=Arthrobacter sp. ov118 TaxID=1761747 RepID=UPI0008F10659|nr:GNAT family N-acetyltransferase [Arthrobacter sp. ov118]SFT78223.1 Protein N-acetyltransferase, RimJ/RimL family [Arthrobacter sp. ov118]